VRRYSLLVYVICNMVPGIAVLWLIAQASGIPSIPVALPQHSWFVVLYIGVFGGVGTYFMWL
jgi:drug/metabolite transporter (DMT)-like permease